MEVQSSTNLALNAFKQNQNVGVNNKTEDTTQGKKTLEETIKESAVKVSISMNAQYILFEMNAKAMAAGNSVGQAGLNASKDQQSVLDFLSGKGKIFD